MTLFRRILNSSAKRPPAPPAPPPGPAVSHELVEWLEGVFPDRMVEARPDESHEAWRARVDRRLGSLDVVRLLRDRAQRPQPTPPGQATA